NDTTDWFPFAPNDNDRLLASVNFDSDTIIGLQGKNGQVGGVEVGYTDGDLTFLADRWNGRRNNGEFMIEGTYFDVGAATSDPITALGLINFGIGVRDKATGNGFILYSAESIHDRFVANAPHERNSDHLIAVQYDGNEWQYNANGGWYGFVPVATDRLLASVNFGADTITSLQGRTGQIGGIEVGYSDGDLTFFANRWNGEENDGEFAVEGTFFETANSNGNPVTDLGPVQRGIAVRDNATGNGFIMYSLESVHDRFSANAPHDRNSDRLIAVRIENGEWQYNANGGWFTFDPVATDRLLASVNFGADTISSLQGKTGQVGNVDLGYADGDLAFYANRWNGKENVGEFTIEGTFFEIDDSVGDPVVSLGPVNRGIAVHDDATGNGYVMYSAESVHDRFTANSPHRHNSDHLIAVRFDNGEWHYNADGREWFTFAPVESDRLVARIRFGADRIISLQGATGQVRGIRRGYTDGDLIFFANRWNEKDNVGEFTIEGTFFQVDDLELP
ncbi:hypothetical protein ACFL2H_01240, partial [Planctomycetota bacterium]